MPLHSSSIVRTELTSLWKETHKERMAYIMGFVHSHKLAILAKTSFFKKGNLRHLQISHNSPYSPRKKFCIIFVFLLGWVLQPSKEKLKTALMQNFGGQNFSITLALFFLWVLPSSQEKLKTAYAKQGLSWKM